MHVHPCRYCKADFICDEPLECFGSAYITCDACFNVHEAKWFWLGILLFIIAAAMTIFIFRSGFFDGIF